MPSSPAERLYKLEQNARALKNDLDGPRKPRGYRKKLSRPSAYSASSALFSTLAPSASGVGARPFKGTKKPSTRLAAFRFLCDPSDALDVRRERPSMFASMEGLSSSQVRVTRFDTGILELAFTLNYDRFVHWLVCSQGKSDRTTITPTNTIFRWYSDSHLGCFQTASSCRNGNVTREIEVPEKLTSNYTLRKLFLDRDHTRLLAHLAQFFQSLVYRVLGQSSHRLYPLGFYRPKVDAVPLTSILDAEVELFITRL